MKEINNKKTSLFTLILPILLLAGCGGSTAGNGSNDPIASGSASANAATLAWDPPSPGANIAGYRLYYGTAPGIYLQAFGEGVSVGNVTSYTLLGLSRGTRYYFAVTAFDTQGNESSFSNETFKDIL